MSRRRDAELIVFPFNRLAEFTEAIALPEFQKPSSRRQSSIGSTSFKACGKKSRRQKRALWQSPYLLLSSSVTIAKTCCKRPDSNHRNPGMLTASCWSKSKAGRRGCRQSSRGDRNSARRCSSRELWHTPSTPDTSLCSSNSKPANRSSTVPGSCAPWKRPKKIWQKCRRRYRRSTPRSAAVGFSPERRRSPSHSRRGPAIRRSHAGLNPGERENQLRRQPVPTRRHAAARGSTRQHSNRLLPAAGEQGSL